jgi:hypothetical protein
MDGAGVQPSDDLLQRDSGLGESERESGLDRRGPAQRGQSEPWKLTKPRRVAERKSSLSSWP